MSLEATELSAISRCPYKERTSCTQVTRLETENHQMLPGCVLGAPKQGSKFEINQGLHSRL